jgi:hypothetical protein
MDEAFDRLTIVQQRNVNKHMFVVAYNCVVRSKGDNSALVKEVRKETADCPELEADLLRYCKLVQRVM